MSPTADTPWIDTALTVAALTPAVAMALMAVLPLWLRAGERALWRGFLAVAGVSVAAAGLGLMLLWTMQPRLIVADSLLATPLSAVLALLVQLLGTVIGGFSARYLQGESGQRRYLAALAGVLAAVHLLLLADHWAVLLPAWAAVGLALQPLLCFYRERPFARLAAHKKHIADRAADLLLVAAAALTWTTVGSGSFSDLAAHVATHGSSGPLQLAALAAVLAVVLRSALLPVHGWLIQVMEAPTPVSALLHAGVVNLGGYVLIRLAPLWSDALPARSLLLALGLATAVLAGMVMLTRISIKVRLAWSTVAQMGFMLMECALGLYTLAALHLVGHSLYKAHAFLSASTVVRQTRLDALHTPQTPGLLSLVVAPLLATGLVLAVPLLTGHSAWPAWWSVLLGLAWAPLLWTTGAGRLRTLAAGSAAVLGLAGLAWAAHAVPLGLSPSALDDRLGVIALAGMAALYIALGLLQWRPEQLRTWRRWSYAGFYLDEAYTRLALRWWPTAWTTAPARVPRAPWAPLTQR